MTGNQTSEVREAIEKAKAEPLESCEYVEDIGQRKSDLLKAFDKMKQTIAATLWSEREKALEETAMERFRTLLDKRGIEYETNDDECAEGEERTTVFESNLRDDIFVTVKEWYCGGELTPWLDVEFHNALTPEQAIAATLGNTKYVYALRGTDPSIIPSYGGETNELLGIYATRKAAEKAKAEYREYCDLDITECEVMGR